MNNLLLQTQVYDQANALVEQCRRNQLPLKEALALMLPKTIKLLGAEGAFLLTYNEDLKLVAFRCGKFESIWKKHVPQKLLSKTFETIHQNVEGAQLLIRPLDCVEQMIGVCAYVFPKELEVEEIEGKKKIMTILTEQLDNYLEGIAATARKHQIMVCATESLRTPIFEEGADQAFQKLSQELNLKQFTLVYGDPDFSRGQHLRYRYYQEGELQHSSTHNPEENFAGLLEKETILNREDCSYSELLGKEGVFEVPLLNGLNQKLIGKLIFQTKASGLSPDGLDIIHIFSECLCQRLFDYNRERRYLGKCFRPDTVQRLLSEPDFFNKYLTPREEPIVILFSDISSFTKICEQVCQSPSEIGEIVNRWSSEVIRVLYNNDGVFDKMVGDCIIGLFGPPFFESSMEQRAKNAILSVQEIVKVTEALGREMGIEKKIEAAGICDRLTTSNGLHVGPTSVGFFGPNDDYTGFSSAMNQAARLQGHAGIGEILITTDVKELAEKSQDLDLDFQGPQQIQVKNVSKPMEYYRLEKKQSKL